MTLDHIDQYETLAIYEPALQAILEQIRTPELLEAHIAQQAQRIRPAVDLRMENNIAVFEIIGALSKYGSSLSPAPAMIDLRRAIRTAARDENIDGILLHIDSPGGTVPGTGDLADEIYAACKIKPVHAFVEDLAASGAYFIASQASTITATESSLVGSIGVYSVLRDYSAVDKRRGVKTIVVRTGKFKGAGIPGTEIDEETIAEVQRVVDAHHELFVKAVARGRGASTKDIEELADGAVHIASEAKSLGLIDNVGSLDDAMDSITSQSRGQAQTIAAIDANDFAEMFVSALTAGESAAETTTETEVQTMANDERTPATLEDLLSCLGGIDAQRDAAFLIEQQQAGATIDQARSVWEEELVRQRQESEAREQAAAQRAEEAEAAKETAQEKPGVEPLGTGESRGGGEDPQQEWDRLIREEMGRGRDRAAAVRAVARDNKGLREALVAAAN